MKNNIFKKLISIVLFLLNQNSTNVIYGQVKIGEQIWMNSNLNTSKFQNGEPIFEAKTKEQWIKANNDKKPAWCYYKNNSQNGAIFGKLYNWYAVNDPRGLAPKGWHVPSKKDWDELIEYLEKKYDNIPKVLKNKSGWKQFVYGGYETGSDCNACNGTGKLWSKISYKYKLCVFCGGTGGDRRYIEKRILQGNGTNESGFSAKPGSIRWDNGEFNEHIGSFTSWWTSNAFTEITSYSISISDNSISEKNHTTEKGYGLSIRLIKDKSEELLEKERILIEEEKKKNQPIIEEFEFLQQTLKRMSFSDAKNFANKLGDGWRLPTKFELNLIYKNKDKNNLFSNLIADYNRNNNYYSYFWSSTDGSKGQMGFALDFKDGTEFETYKYNELNFILIRNYNQKK